MHFVFIFCIFVAESITERKIMPRKTNGMPFEVHRSPKADEDGRVLLYAAPQSNRTKDFDEIEGWLSISNSVRKGDLLRAFAAFLDECSLWLSKGYRVQTPLGVFSPKIGLKRKVTNPREVRHDDAEFKGIDFRPSAGFTKAVRLKVKSEGFRYVHKADSTVLSANEEYMMEALRKSIRAEGNYTTVSSFMFHSGLSKYAATKMLRHWCCGDAPLLRERRLGHSIIYEVIGQDKG